MSLLTTMNLLRIWESGERQGLQDRALTILAVAFPEFTRDELANWSLGQRDRRLYHLHQQLFGPNLDGLAECPHCGQQLEFSLPIPSLGDLDFVEPASLGQTTFDGFEIAYRLPNGRDLIDAAACGNGHQARQLLLRRCLQQARYRGADFPTVDLPESTVSQLVTHLAELDPWQEVLLELCCDGCGHRWDPVLDIVSFVWTRLASQATRLLREVHALAKMYGWTESEILSLSPRRRQAYLEMEGG